MCLKVCANISFNYHFLERGRCDGRAGQMLRAQFPNHGFDEGGVLFSPRGAMDIAEEAALASYLPSALAQRTAEQSGQV